MAKGPLFLNTPISSMDQDAIGVNLFVDKLNTAIDNGAQMIAITSPFGAGKSSVIEMLQHTHEKRSWWKFWQRKDIFVEVSMWSHLNSQESNGSTVELHKSFIYQMASQIKPRKGTYINRRLSQNYGLLRLHTNRKINWYLITIALLLFATQSYKTTSIITKLSSVYATAPHITDRVRQEKKYFWYVSSKTQWDKKFVIEDDEVLWNIYVEMFGKTKSDSWQQTKACMAENTEFLHKLMERREYVKFDDENRMKLTKILQDERCVEEAFSRSAEFALSYFLQVSGFQDKNAASKFIDLIILNGELLASNELYEHIYDKLVDRTLKAKYTYRRNRQAEN